MSQLAVGYFSSFLLLKKKSAKRKTLALGRPGMRNLAQDLNPPNPGVTGSYWKEIPAFPLRDSRNRLIFIGFQYGQREWELLWAPKKGKFNYNAEASWMDEAFDYILKGGKMRVPPVSWF